MYLLVISTVKSRFVSTVNERLEARVSHFCQDDEIFKMCRENFRTPFESSHVICIHGLRKSDISSTCART